MDITPVAFTTVLVAIAGPLGITLGWWLGKRAERDRTAREERKSAYVAFTSASMKYRNADEADRRSFRNERWEALAVLTMVAPPPIVHVAAHMAAAGEGLLDPALDESERQAIYAELWRLVTEYTRLVRVDLKVGDADAFAGLNAITGERISFERPRVASTEEYKQ
jgi:hypothetical protein